MTKVRIKTSNVTDPGKKLRLLQLLSENEIYANRIIVASDAFIIITNDEADLDRLFNGTTDQYLQNNGFEPVLPPELKAKRSIMVFNVDNHIFSNEKEEIISETMDRNAFTNNQITDLVKISNNNNKNIKITFTKTNIAKRATETGLRMFSMSISPHQIEQDKYIEIKSCMRCYIIEDHNTSECPRPRDYKLCSECAEEGHIWRNCPNNYKKCINCHGEHRTLAMKCQKRKDVINQKRKDERENTTYSNVTKRNTNTQHQQINYSGMPVISPSSHQLSYDCFMYAHMINAGKPGSYQVEVNNIRKMNNLPPIKTPDNPPSLLILKVMSNQTNTHLVTTTEETNTSSEGASAIITRENETIEEQMDSVEEAGTDVSRGFEAPEVLREATATQGKSKKRIEEQFDSVDEAGPDVSRASETPEVLHETITTQGKRKYGMRGEDIGLMIYTKQAVGWPKKDDFSKQVLLQGIKDRKYKYTYTNKDLKDEDIINMIQNKILDVTKYCFAQVDNSTYSKIRSGLTEERTPPPSKEARIRKDSR